MESSSVKLNSKKRKKQSPSPPIPLIGIFTRSKSQSSSSNLFSRKLNSVQPGVVEETGTEPVEAFLELNNEISYRISSIKDLRVHRVFSPAVTPILEEEEGKINEKSNLLQNMDLGADSDRFTDLNVGNKKVEENKQSGETVPSEADAKENNSKNDVNLTKNEAISANGSISKSKTVINAGYKRKVFKTPSSFSYRRLLPHLMDIVKEESSVSDIEIVDVEFPNKLQEFRSPEMPSIMENDCAAKFECIGAQTNRTDDFKDEEIQKFDKEQPCTLQNLSSVEHQLKHRSHENGASGVEDSVKEEEQILMKPDPNVFSATAVRDSGRNMEVKTLLIERPNLKGTRVGCTSIGNKSCHSSNGKGNINLRTEKFLTPCSQPRVFKTPSSVNYRRLLPYLIEVAKENSCDSKIIQHRKPQTDSKDIHQLSCGTSDEENPGKKMRMESFSKKPHTEDEEQNLLPAILPPVNGSSSDPDNNLSPLHSTNDSSKLRPSSIVADDTTDLIVPLDLPKERTLAVQNTPQKFESEIPHNDTMDHEGKSNYSAVQSCSVVERDILTEEFCSKLLEPQPVDTKIKCMAISVEAHKSNEKLIQDVTLYQSPSQIEISDNLVAPIDGLFKGVLKKNPKGCGGPCNCLNCASFRLHAERAFEFLRNQMHDAGEVAWSLLKELANVRHILEKSAVNYNNLTTVQLNQVNYT
ncbi:uncharacterized protein LOC111390847 [Olea europaea var. sylvestris]|uniref:uncharacterized protein LOC111390847 n=1 Tax=Olea europaea var. sylvestris TaxID=158386 RepID=UPI000C1D5160|nr:uncharacterized protein LOC111390847 [Olea europaea var. sylvestris]